MIQQFHKYPCAFCKKKEATQFCDFVVGYSWTSAKNERGRMIGPQHETCDNQVCKDCMVNVAGYEFCPSCNELHKYVIKNHERRKGRMMSDIVFGHYEEVKT